MKIVPVILAGGKGERLWPLSSNNLPKPFLDLFSGGTLFSQTIERVCAATKCEEIIIIANKAHKELIQSSLNKFEDIRAKVFLEPVGKNTAPAAALAAIRIKEAYRDAFMLVLPADHIIQDKEEFAKSIEQASKAAAANFLVTFGILPKYPATGFGYINVSEQNGTYFKVHNFLEKPIQRTAEKLISEGNNYWNSGMFLMKSSVFLSELKEHSPEMYDVIHRVYSAHKNIADLFEPVSDSFADSPSDSIDYAVMEKSSRVAMVLLEAGWSDVGSWDACHEVEGKDSNGNTINGKVILSDSQGCYVRTDRKMTIVSGLKDCVVVDSNDALLVTSSEKLPNLKHLLTQVPPSTSTLSGEKVEHRPWGSYESIRKENSFQIKKIVVEPGQKLSLQKHKHRAETWVVVSGRGQVIKGNETFALTAGSYIHIRQGEIHRMTNPSNEPLVFVEVQFGQYLGEDDIERLEDNYGRVETTQ